MDHYTGKTRILGWGSYELWLVICFFFGWGLIFLDAQAVSYCSALIVEEFGINNTQVGLIGTVGVGTFALTSLFVGAISDRLGYRKRLLVPCLLGCSIFAALGATTHTYGGLLITRALVGCFEGPILALVMAIMAQHSSENRFSTNCGIINAGVAVIAVLIGPTLLTQIASASNWRMAFLGAAIPTFILGIVTALTVKEVKVDIHTDAAGKKTSIFDNFGIIFKTRNLFLCLLVGLFGMSGYWSLMQFATLFWTTAGLSVTTTGIVISSMGIACIFYAIFVPKISDVIGRVPALAISYFICALVPFSMAVWGGAPITIWTYILFGGVPGAMTTMYMTIIPLETVSPALAGSVGGLILAAAQLVGGSLWPVIYGRIADATSGFSTSMICAGVLFAIAATISCFIKETNTKEMRRARKEAVRVAKSA